MVNGPGQASKRKFSNDGIISPPPLKRKQTIPSTTTKKAVTSFFTPTSRKTPEKIKWQERAVDGRSPNTLLVGKYTPENTDTHNTLPRSTRKIAAFDFDSTLILTSSGKKFAGDANDWKWWHLSVPAVLKKLYIEDGYHVVILSNQAGIALKPDPKVLKAQQSKLANFKNKVAMVLNQLDLPLTIYAATEKDIFRKPRTGMWTELLDDFDLGAAGTVDLAGSFFVGDAGGRTPNGVLPKDFSCSDRNFAENVGIKFMTPEEFFLNDAPRDFARTFEPSNYMLENGSEEIPALIASAGDGKAQDIVLFCGSPGAGKSTTYWKYLQPLGYERVNQDTLKTRDRCIKAADDYLLNGKSVVVDNTNPDKEVRSKWIELAKKHKIPIRCLLFNATTQVCEHNDAVRALNHTMNPEKRTILPALAFRGFASRFQRPEQSEGFQDIVEINFQFTGTEAEREIWARYWT